MNVPVCPVGGPKKVGLRVAGACLSVCHLQAIQAYEPDKVDPWLLFLRKCEASFPPAEGKFLNPYLDWKGPKFEKVRLQFAQPGVGIACTQLARCDKLWNVIGKVIQ